jgi:hypothetical protein
MNKSEKSTFHAFSFGLIDFKNIEKKRSLGDTNVSELSNMQQVP